MRKTEYREGRTRLVVPAASLEEDPPPTSPVFFNPAASVNRDISVAVAAATGGRTFCDSMAGVGARGVRIASEVRTVDDVALVDFNAEALKLAKLSAKLNGIGRKCEFSKQETSSFLYSRYGKSERFDYVDVDPFGTPVRQLQAALSATADGGLLSVTATDTAVLCGVYPKVAKRRYGASPMNNHFHHETAVRILMGTVARQGAALDIGVAPFAAHSTRHYVRVYARVRAGASRADAALGNLGHIVWCPACGNASLASDNIRTCQRCGKKAKCAGPLWTGRVTEPDSVRASKTAAERMNLKEAAKVLASLVGVDDFPPWSFSLESICSSLGTASVSESDVRSILASGGFRAFRQPFERLGLKTDAGFDDVTDAVREAARRPLARSVRASG